MPELTEEEVRTACKWLKSAGIVDSDGEKWFMTEKARALMDATLKSERPNEAFILTLLKISRGLLDMHSIHKFVNVMQVLYYGKPRRQVKRASI